MNPLFKFLIWGFTAALLSGTVCYGYAYAYRQLTLVDYSAVINVYGMYGASMVGCIAAAIGYWVLSLFIKNNWADIIHNFVFGAITWASLYGPFTFNLPDLGDEAPPGYFEMFYGLAVPLHFIPILCWLMLRPFFRKDQQEIKLN